MTRKRQARAVFNAMRVRVRAVTHRKGRCVLCGWLTKQRLDRRPLCDWCWLRILKANPDLRYEHGKA